ncbi:MAG TPA: hypothetical protein VFV71_03940 [Burkholderiales bacterium]|nr:hypothetical protein [Burkholderiales bacterium]
MNLQRLLAICAMVCVAGTGAAQQPSSTSEVRIEGSMIAIDCDCPNGPSLDLLRPWITDAADAVKTYFGRFPVRSLRIAVTGSDGRGVHSGKTFTYRGALIRVGVGRDTGAADLKRDWVMTHEMIHLTQPELDERHAWMQEGMATYVEPVARVQAGQLDASEIWRDMVRDMPKGLPAAGDRGLDNTPTWGRTYWGGAMFFLFADVGIREQTGNRLGLQHALRAMLDARGKPIGLQELFAIGDRATGTTVLVDLYGKMAAAPMKPDLEDLWRRLGVARIDGGVRFDDQAPLAKVRKAITAAPAN